MKENLLKETQQAHNKPFSGNIVLIGFMGAGKVRFLNTSAENTIWIPWKWTRLLQKEKK